MYVPNNELWIKFYEKVGTLQHPKHMMRRQTQLGGSISKTASQRIIPIDKKPQSRDAEGVTNIKVNLVSPSEQTVQQAETELKLDTKKGKKRKGIISEHSKKKKKKKKKKITRTIEYHGGNQF